MEASADEDEENPRWWRELGYDPMRVCDGKVLLYKEYQDTVRVYDDVSE